MGFCSFEFFFEPKLFLTCRFVFFRREKVRLEHFEENSAHHFLGICGDRPLSKRLGVPNGRGEEHR
jgi:hypothetical protein